jgi:hypothetical protein
MYFHLDPMVVCTIGYRMKRFVKTKHFLLVLHFYEKSIFISEKLSVEIYINEFEEQVFRVFTMCGRIVEKEN